MAEGSFVPLFMGNDGSGPFHVSGQPGHGPLPVTFGAPPTGLDVNSTTQFKGADGLIYDVKAATSGDGPLPVILANALGPLITDSLTQFHGTDGVIYTVKGAPGDGPLPVQLAAGGAPAPVHIDPAQFPLPVHLDPTQLPLPVLLAAGGAPAAIAGVTANGAAPAGNPVLISGWDGANTRAVLTDPTGAVYVNTQPPKATYSASGIITVAPQAAAGIVFTLRGSATKTVRIRQVHVDLFSATVQFGGAFLSRIITMPTDGVSLPMAPAKFNTADPNPTATALQWTTVGTTGFAAGAVAIFCARMVSYGDPAHPLGNLVDWEPPSGGEAVALIGINEIFCVSSTLPTYPQNAAYQLTVIWTEE